jgi:hypothetical protein
MSIENPASESAPGRIALHESTRVVCDKYVCLPFVDTHDPRAVHYIRADLAMHWIPIAEADLQDGEKVSCWFASGGTMHELEYGAKNHVFMKGADGCSANAVSHVLRIKPPRTSEL